MSNEFFYESERNRSKLARAYHNVMRRTNSGWVYGDFRQLYSKFEDKSDSGFFNYIPPNVAPYDYSGIYSVLIQSSGFEKIRIDAYGVPDLYTEIPYEIDFFNKDTKRLFKGYDLYHSNLGEEFEIPEESDGRIFIAPYHSPAESVLNYGRPYTIQLL